MTLWASEFNKNGLLQRVQRPALAANVNASMPSAGPQPPNG